MLTKEILLLEQTKLHTAKVRQIHAYKQESRCTYICQLQLLLVTVRMQRALFRL